MLEKISIKNFQSHRNTILNLSKGITGIVGNSLFGKTVVIRGVKWVVNNRPGGFRFHSDFAEKKEPTTVLLGFDDIEVKLTKSKGKSLYTIKEDDEKPKSFRKFKQSVPDIITSKVNLNDINFQNQLDDHFLITSSGGKIAKAISHITQADKIINWIQKITKKLAILKITKKILLDDIEKINIKLKKLKRINRLDEIISKIEKLEEQDKKIKEKIWEIKNQYQEIKKIKKALRRQKQYLQVKPNIKTLERLGERLAALRQQKLLLLKIKQMQNDIKTKTKAKAHYIEQYIQLIKSSKSCPTCLGVINKRTIEKIKRELQRR